MDCYSCLLGRKKKPCDFYLAWRWILCQMAEEKERKKKKTNMRVEIHEKEKYDRKRERERERKCKSGAEFFFSRQISVGTPFPSWAVAPTHPSLPLSPVRASNLPHLESTWRWAWECVQRMLFHSAALKFLPLSFCGPNVYVEKSSQAFSSPPYCVHCPTLSKHH